MSDPRRLRLWLYRAVAVFLGTLAWAALPGGVSADNCSGLSDCYGTVASALAATVGIALVLATVVSLPSILSALESMAARSLDTGAFRDATDATAGSSVAPAPAGDTDLSRGSHPDLQAAQSMAKASPRFPDQPGVGYAASRPDAPPQVAPPDAVPPHQQAGFIGAGGAPGGDMQDLGRGYGAPTGPVPGVSPQGQDASPAQSLHDLSRAGSGPPPTGSSESGPAAMPGDLSRGAGSPVPPTGAAGAAAPAYGHDLGRAPVPGGLGSDATRVSASPAGPGSGGFAAAPPAGGDALGTKGLPAGATPGGLASAPTPGGDALQPGQGGSPGAVTPAGYRESGQDLAAGQHPVASPGGGVPRGGVGGGAETGPVAGSTDLTCGQAVPAPGGDQSMARAGGAPIGGEQTMARAGDPSGATAPPAAPTAGDASPGQPYGAPAAQPPAGMGGLGRAPLAPTGSGGSPPPGGLGAVPAGPADAGVAGPGVGDATGAGFGAAIARQVLDQAPYLDHTAQLVAAAQGVIPGAIGGAAGAAAAAAIVQGLGLESGPTLDLGDVLVTPSADATQALRFLKASGTFEVGPLDPQARALLLVGAAIVLDPSRSRPAFGRYLRWAESGAPPEALERDLDLAIIRAAGPTRIGQVRRADVLRVLGAADQEWVGGNRYAGYRVAEWPGYLYVFEFDTADVLRNQGFVASPSPPPAAPLAAGMTRDAAWSRLGPPGAADGWWPFERWRYRFPDGHVETYEFAHGILRRAVRA